MYLPIESAAPLYLARVWGGSRVLWQVSEKFEAGSCGKDIMEESPVVPNILESITDGLFTVDHEWRVMSFNRAAERITGFPRNEALNRKCWDVFRSSLCGGDCPLQKTFEVEQPFINVPAYITTKYNKRVPVSISTALLHGDQGEVLGGVETFRDNSIAVRKQDETDYCYRQGGMVSCSQLMNKIFKLLPKIAESDSTILIEGDTGTGKEVLARAIHNLSSRKDKPFIALNCGALPDTLLESELFGYKAGAFTDAVNDKPGYFALADGGTIMLDELGETSPAFQAKLLRVIEEREFQPLGGVEKKRVNVRILAATNRDLEAAIEQGEFRQDLFYRINVVRLQLPALKKRKEDIELLAECFIEKLNNVQGKAITGIDKEAAEVLLRYHYPGNIRELENIVEHAFILCSQGDITTDHLPEYIFSANTSVGQSNASIDSIRNSSEEEAIIKALQRNDFNRLATARDLGMHKTTLFRKIKKYNIHLPDTDGRTASHRKEKL